MTNARTQACVEGSIKLFSFGCLTKSSASSQSQIARILNYRRMADIDCLYIKPRTTSRSFDRPNISVVVGATAGNVTMRIKVLCLLLKVLHLTRVWNAGLGQSYAEK